MKDKCARRVRVPGADVMTRCVRTPVVVYRRTGFGTRYALCERHHGLNVRTFVRNHDEWVQERPV